MDDRAFRDQRGLGVGVGNAGDGRSQRRFSIGREVEQRRFPAQGPARRSRPEDTQRSAPSRPSRVTPAPASTIDVQSPASSFRRRVSTLPRSGVNVACGKLARSCATRRTLVVPIVGLFADRAHDGRPVASRSAIAQEHHITGIRSFERGTDGQAIRQESRADPCCCERRRRPAPRAAPPRSPSRTSA